MDLINDDSEERVLLENDIKRLKYEFQTTKERIFKLYTIKRKTELFSNGDTESLLLSTIKRNPKLELYFHNQFIKLQCKQDESLITVLFPFNGEYRFGCNLLKHLEWSFEKYQLPSSIDVEYFRNEIKHASLQTVSKLLEEMQKNVYAFCIREEHVEELKEIIDSRIRLYHCLRYTELELTFKVFDTETNIRRLVTVQLNFDLLSIQPSVIVCKVKSGEDNEDIQNFVNNHFKIFNKNDIVRAYKLAFKNVDRYKFFV